jgi:hypothetical protein
MFALRSRVLLLVASFACMVADLPGIAFADPAARDEQTLTIQDSRLGTGPCGFAIQRDIEGTVAITPSVDDAGNLMLTIAPVDLWGSLTNPANGKSVDLNWIRQNGKAHFGADGSSTEVALALTGHFFRGYDNARSDLAMALPADTAEMIAFETGARSEDPWTHICGLLA